MLPGITDVRSGALGDPGALPAEVHIQTADRIAWMTDGDKLPRFERFPGG